MTGAPSAGTRAIASIASASIVALVPLLWLGYALQHASYAALGRDQGIFQGTAWAIAHGAVLYRDLREINGPLVHELHLLARLLGGADPRALRVFDLVTSALVFAFFGAALPGAIGVHAARRRPFERVAWAAAACVVLLSQYLAFYDYWHLTQRESFFDWFVLLGFAGALRARTAASSARARMWLICAGIASATPWFGKPLCVLYSILHVLTIALATPLLPISRSARASAFGLGIAVGCAMQLAFLTLFCDLPGFLRIYFVENPRYYFHIWPRFLDDIVAIEGHSEFYVPAITLSLLTLWLIAQKQLASCCCGMAAFPLAGIALDIVQRKGFTYHLHPVTAGAAVIALLLVCVFSDGFEPGAGSARGVWRSIALAGVLGYWSAQALIVSPHLRVRGNAGEANLWPVPAGMQSLAQYDTRSFSAAGLAEAGAFLKRRTVPSDRIQMYGMDPYLLALAARQSATPYIYAIDLNPDAVLDGLRKEGASLQAQAAARALARAHVADLVKRVHSAPPAAFVFFDRAPFKHPASALSEFSEHVPELVPWLRANYHEAAAFSLLHVHLRNDRWTETASEH
jgi:hypothetical protein